MRLIVTLEKSMRTNVRFTSGPPASLQPHSNIHHFPQIHPFPTHPKMSSSLPLQIAETIQTASINRAPSPTHDVNPSTAASQKEPVTLSHPQQPPSDSSLSKYAYDDEDVIDEDDEDEEDIPYSVLKSTPRRASFGPLPDLRFEQSYLASIAGADTRWKVMYITVRDQVYYLYFIF